MTAGKLLHEFKHQDAITAIKYHPSEFVMATSSADRTVKWWDLETSELIDTAGPETTGGLCPNLPDPPSWSPVHAQQPSASLILGFYALRMHDRHIGTGVMKTHTFCCR